jgi:hypothetical protein
VTDSSQRIVLVPRAGIDVDSDAGEVAGQGFGRNTDAIRECGDLVEFGGVLGGYQKCVACSDMASMLTRSSATAVARLLLPAHVADLVSDSDVFDSPRAIGR